MSDEIDDRIYQALPLPKEAIANGGVEILRAGVIDAELYVTARRAFTDPAQWGEALADITRRLALLYDVEGEYSEAEALAAIESAYAADLGAALADAPARARKPAAKAGRRASKSKMPRTVAKAKTKSKAKSKAKTKSASAKPARAAPRKRATAAKRSKR